MANSLEKKSVRVGGVFCVLLAVLALAGACNDAEQAAGRGTGRVSKKVADAKKGEAGGAEGGSGRALEALVFKDDDFVESLRNRDPFRSYTMTMRADAPDEIQRRVIMPTTGIEEMRLIAIVTGMPQPKAMLVDPRGTGFVVQRGDYVGRPKIIQATGSVSMTLNWRVDRIRDNEVVLTQQDPSDLTRSALTKIIPLNEEVARK